MAIIKISGNEKGELDAIARQRLISALRYNLPRSDLEEIIEDAYKCYCDRKEEVVKQIKIKTEVWEAIEKEAKIYKRDPLELVGSILSFHYVNVIEE